MKLYIKRNGEPLTAASDFANRPPIDSRLGAAVGWAIFLIWLVLTAASTHAIAQTNVHLEMLRAAPAVTVSRAGVWRAGRVLLPVVTNSGPISVLQRQGTNYVAVPNSQAILSGKPHIAIPTNSWSIIRPAALRAPVKLSTNLTLSRDVGVACISSTEGIDARLFVKAEESPMLWDKHRLEYRTNLRIGFLATNAPSAPLPPVAVLLQTHNLTLEDETNRMLTLREPGLTGSIPVCIIADKFKTNASIVASTDVGEEAFLVEIQRLRLWDMIIQLCPGPVLFLILIGSGAGGFLRSFGPGKKGRSKPWLRLVEGLVAGPLVLSLVVGLGVSLPLGKVTASTLTSPWAWVAISAIGGYGGAALFEKMAFKRDKAA